MNLSEYTARCYGEAQSDLRPYTDGLPASEERAATPSLVGFPVWPPRSTLPLRLHDEGAGL